MEPGHGGKVSAETLAAYNLVNALLEDFDRGSDPLLW
jgi:hypothetical protein